MIRTNKDELAGLTFVIIALVFGLQSFAYDRGDFFRMGPGLFPAVLSGLLLLFGAVITLKGLVSNGESATGVSIRAVILVLLAPIVFALTIEGAGLVLSSLLLVLMSAFASRTMTLVRALATAAVLLALVIGIFIIGLNMQVPMWGDWFKGAI